MRRVAKLSGSDDTFPLYGFLGRFLWNTWSEMCKLACVNRLWRCALHEWAAMQRCLMIDQPGTLFPTVRYFGRLCVLCVTGGALERGLLAALPAFGGTLESFELRSAGEDLDVTDSLLLRMANLCGKLRRVAIAGAEEISSVGVAALAATNPLTNVSFRGCSGVTSHGVQALAVLRPKLRKFELGAVSTDVSGLDTAVVAHSIAMLTELETLDLSRITIDDGDLGRIAAGCERLSSLGLRGCSALATASFAEGPSLQRLLTLCLYGCSGLTDDAARSLARLASRPGASLLQKPESSLDLTDCISLTSAGLRHFADGTPRAGTLQLPDVDEEVLECALDMTPCRASGSHLCVVVAGLGASPCGSCRFTRADCSRALLIMWDESEAWSAQLQSKLKYEYVYLLPEADRAWHSE